jgi:hypothetical protein
MLNSIVSAFLVIRLELRSPSPPDVTDMLLEWFHRPTIEILFERRQSEEKEESVRLTAKLNEVYPF